jgi:hypothetical protein
MTYECEGGTPRKFVVKKPLKAGDTIKKGQYFRVELSWSETDEDVKGWCDAAAQNLCKDVSGAHFTYYKITNTVHIAEAQATEDFTVPAELAPYYYLLQPIWEAYKIPIIIAIIALGGFTGYMMLKRR